MCERSDRKRDEGLVIPEDVEYIRDIRYGRNQKYHELDICWPKSEDDGKKYPVIISIHGGGYVYGTKEVYQFYAADLASHGYAVVNFNYRLAPKNRFPAPLEDLQRVILWLMENKKDYPVDLGNVYPKLHGGFGTSVSYGGFDASAQFSYQLGGKYYDGSYQALMHTQSNPGNAMHKDLLNAWTPENTNTDVPRLDGDVLLAQTACDRFLISSNFLCLNNAQIGYTFPAATTKKLGIGTLRVYVAGENLFLLTARKGLDPRYSTGLGSYTAGSAMNNNDYTSTRNITGGFTLTF